MSEQIGLNYQGILDNQKKIGELEEIVTLVQKALLAQIEINKHYVDRLRALEEKERARAIADHNREAALDDIYVPPQERDVNE